MGTKVTKEFTQETWTTKLPDSGGNPSVGYIKGPGYTDVTTKAGVSVSNYREKLRNGSNATSAYSVVATKRQSTRGFALVTTRENFFGKPKTVERSVQGHFAPYLLADTGGSSFVADALNDATIAFLGKVRARQTKFNGMTALGELKEALHGIRNPAQAIKDLMTRNLLGYDKLRRRRYRNKRALRSVIRSTWLEYAFHWAPLIGQAEDAAEALSEQIHQFRKEIEVVRHKLEYSTGLGSPSWNDAYQVPGYSGYFLLTSDGKITARSEHVGGVRCRAAGGTGGGFDSKLWGFHPRDFVPTIWELIPWSWAVDYFSNVGKVLSCWSYGTADLEWYSRTNTTLRECTTSVSLHEENTKALFGSAYIAGRGGPSTSTHSRFELNRGGQLQLPSVRWDIGFPGWAKMANLASAVSLRARVSSNLSIFSASLPG